MGLLKSRERFSNKGLGDLEVKEVSPTNDAAYQYLGNLDESQIQDVEEVDEIKDENGSMQNALSASLASRMISKLQQVGIDEMSYIQAAALKYHSIRYSGLANAGMFQYFCFPYGKIIRKLERPFVKGKQTIPFEFLGLKQELSYDVPEFYFAEAKAKIRTQDLQLWVNPRGINAYNYLTAKVLDISGFERHGSLNSDYATIWQAGTTPERSLLLDGVNDILDIGNVLNDDGVSDLLLEGWFKIIAADATNVWLMTKKTNDVLANPGYGVLRLNNNKVLFYISNGSTQAAITTASSVLQNVWKHLAVAIDRNGNGQIYINGVADGAAVSVASVGSGTNALSYLIGGSSGPSYSNLQTGGYRHYKFAAGGLPSDVATIIANHYNAEKRYYGL